MLHKAMQDVGECAAGFACRDHVHIKGRKSSRELAKALREAPPVNQPLMQSLCHLLDARLLEPFFKNREPFVQSHPGLEQVRQLFRENKQLTVRNLERLRRKRRRVGRSLARGSAVLTVAADRAGFGSGCNEAVRSA